MFYGLKVFCSSSNSESMHGEEKNNRVVSSLPPGSVIVWITDLLAVSPAEDSIFFWLENVSNFNLVSVCCFIILLLGRLIYFHGKQIYNKLCFEDQPFDLSRFQTLIKQLGM